MTLEFIGHAILQSIATSNLKSLRFLSTQSIMHQKNRKSQRWLSNTAIGTNHLQTATRMLRSVSYQKIMYRRYYTTTVQNSVNAQKQSAIYQPTNHIQADYNFALPATLSQITSQGQGPNCVTGIIQRASLR
jgi:hypothetical protein